jgi:hypothetical protein
MVNGANRQVGPSHSPPRRLEAGEGLRRRDLVDQMKVDVEQRWIGVDDHVVVPHLLEEGA